MSQPLTIEALEVLDAIDTKGSFAAAAESLYRVPSAITYTINKLEKDLGVTLFRKEGRRSVLTPAGQVLLDQGRELLIAAESLVETTRQVDSGWESCLNIAIDSVIDFKMLYLLVEQYYLINPDIELNLYEEVLGGSWEAIHQGRASIVIGAIEAPANTRGLRYEEIMRVNWQFAVARNHPLVQLKRPVEEADVQNYRAVVVRDSSRSLPPLTRHVFDKQAMIRVDTVAQKIDAQMEGIGVGFLPRHRIEEHLQSGDLVALPMLEPIPDSSLNLVWRANDKGRAMRWFVERIRELFLFHRQ